MLKETPIHKWAIAFLQKVMKNKRVKLLAKEITISQIYMIYVHYDYEIYIYISNKVFLQDPVKKHFYCIHLSKL